MCSKLPLPKRLKDARLQAGLTQQKLGVLAGIDESSASPRINQYERGKHVPDYQTAQKLMNVIGIPVAYLYAYDDDLAELIMLFSKMPKNRKKRLITQIGNSTRKKRHKSKL